MMALLDALEARPSLLASLDLELSKFWRKAQEKSAYECNIDKQVWSRKNNYSSQSGKDENSLWVNLNINNHPCSLAFVYGTLKKGFGNHWLMEDLMTTGHARYIGFARTKDRFPLVCGPFAVPFLLHIPNTGEHVRGEVYQVDETALAKLDELEGVDKGHYVRHPVGIADLQLDPGVLGNQFGPMFPNSLSIRAEAYFAAEDYAPEMSREVHIDCYSEKEAASYVRRKDRPQNRTFMEHIQAWIKEKGDRSIGKITANFELSLCDGSPASV